MDRKGAYAEKLRDPRWQKRRLEIFQRDEFRCQLCFDDSSTLNVHHRRYFRNRDPWEYEGIELVTLCESCHGQEQMAWPEAMAHLSDAFISSGYFAEDIEHLAESISSSGYGHPQHFLNLVTFLSVNREAYEYMSGRFHEAVNSNRSEAVTPARTASE